ncbi:MAG: thiamine pyrophosphate-binding protein [Chloroflexi bacterium]|nr:thiamine pyrophosphate-binding protein [Chloroflexota bacterium]
MAKISGNTLVARALKAEGVDTIFYLGGGPMFDVMFDSFAEGIRGIDTRHEQGAAMMAHAYARVTGKPGICNTSSGPGTINAATGMANALADACPVILLAGAGPLRDREMEAFQEFDQVGTFRPITKWSTQIYEARRIPELVSMGFRKATMNRPGPVLLDFPGDVLYSEVEESDVIYCQNVQPPARPWGNPDAVKEAVGHLRGAEKPLILTGTGVLFSGAAEELRELVDLTGIPILTTPQGRGAVPDDHGLMFASARSTALREADVLLVIGTRFNVILSFGRAPRYNANGKVIMVNIDGEEIGKNRGVDLGIIGDAKMVLRQLIAEASKGDWRKDTAWVQHLRGIDAKKRTEMEPFFNSDHTPIHPLRLCKELRDVLDRDAIVCVDGHDTLNFGRQSIPTYEPNHRLNAGPSGCMGVAIPYAVAAKAAKPDKQVVALTGDGSFGMNGFEIDTAIRHKLPFVTVISNNGGWTANHPPKPGRDLNFSRYDKIVETLGGHGECVERPEDIRPALERALRADVPSCVNVMVDPAAKSETLRFSVYFQR